MKLCYFWCDGDAFDALSTSDGVGRRSGPISARPSLEIAIPRKVEIRFRPNFEIPIVPRAQIGRTDVGSVDGFEIGLEEKLGRTRTPRPSKRSRRWSSEHVLRVATIAPRHRRSRSMMHRVSSSGEGGQILLTVFGAPIDGVVERLLLFDLDEGSGQDVVERRRTFRTPTQVRRRIVVVELTHLSTRPTFVSTIIINSSCNFEIIRFQYYRLKWQLLSSIAVLLIIFLFALTLSV